MKKYFAAVFMVLMLLTLSACEDSSTNIDNSEDGDAEDSGEDLEDAEDSDGDNGSDGDAEETDVSALIEQGKQALRDNLPDDAKGFFGQANEIDPENTDAVFGLSLATLQGWIGILDELISSYGSGMGPGGQVKADGDEEENPGEQIVRLISEVYAESKTQLERFAWLKERPDFIFTLDHFPIVIKERTIIDMHSEWDLADVYHMNSMLNIFHMIITLASSQSMDANWDEADFDEEGENDIDQNIENIAKFMSDNPGFLNVDEEIGAERWTEARNCLYAFAEDYVKSMKLMAKETDDQADDVYIHNDTTEIKHKDHYGMQGDFISGEKLVLMLWSGQDLSPEATMEQLMAHLDGNADLRTQLEDDILMMIGVMADFIIQAVSIEVMADMFEVELGEEAQSLIDLYFGSRDDGEDIPKLFSGTLPNLIGLEKNTIQFDFYTFFLRPFPFREFLTNIGPNPFTGKPVFLQSVECARLGYGAAEFAAGDELQIKLHDRGAANATGGVGNDNVMVTVVSREVAGESGDPAIIDTEELTIAEDEVVEAYFADTLLTESISDAADAVADDGVLQVLSRHEVVAQYTDEGGEEAYEIIAAYSAEGATERLFGYTMDCQEDTKRDWGHFAEVEYEDACIIPDPPAEITCEAPYPAIERDGIKSTGVYAPLRSPTMNGLIWIDARKVIGSIAEDLGFPEGFYPADPRSINAYTQNVQQKLASFGEGGMPF